MMYSVPSGALANCAGRNQMSVEATNSLPGVGPAGDEPDALGLEHLAMHDVAAHVADERLADDTRPARRRRDRS